MEQGLWWREQQHLELVPRLEKLGTALLTIKEIEHFGAAQPGGLDERISRLAASHVGALEKRYLAREHKGWLLERIRRLRHWLVRQLVQVAADPQETEQTRAALDTLLFCENLSAQSWEYLRERPSLERLTETVQRIEETITDQFEIPVTALGATVAVGPATDGRRLPSDKETDGEGLGTPLRRAIQELLNQMLEQGPPPEWNCPAPIEPRTAHQRRKCSV
jgi:hypothetical protein